jgi:hypothetical protein
MRLVGFSTGALAYADFRRGLHLLDGSRARAVELSALRMDELGPLLEALDSLDLGRYEFVSVHAPSGLAPLHERQVVKKLMTIAERGWPVVVHPDSIHDVSLWRPLGKSLCIENMDKRKPVGRTRDELARWFHDLPDASFCLDLAHARQIDPTMTEAYLMLRDFGSRLAEVHLSEINSACKHEPISYSASLAYGRVASLIPSSVPIILESILGSVLIDDEIEAAHRALPACAAGTKGHHVRRHPRAWKAGPVSCRGQ